MTASYARALRPLELEAGGTSMTIQAEQGVGVLAVHGQWVTPRMPEIAMTDGTIDAAADRPLVRSRLSKLGLPVHKVQNVRYAITECELSLPRHLYHTDTWARQTTPFYHHTLRPFLHLDHGPTCQNHPRRNPKRRAARPRLPE